VAGAALLALEAAGAGPAAARAASQALANGDQDAQGAPAVR
jgi:hypothetical protein